MALEHGDSYGLMRGLKTMMDPKGLMNPGKIFIEA
jgi:FAD/FMN-containing dehydrogenase